MKKIIVLAGVFDPVHKGHVKAVLSLIIQTGADRAVVVPEKVPQHKHGATAYHHRYEMLVRAFTDYKNIEVLESPISEHTIVPFFSWLNTRFRGSEFIWMVGSDVISHIHTWQDIEKLPSLGVCEIAVCKRAGYSETEMTKVGEVPLTFTTCDEGYPHVSSRKIREGLLDERKYLHPKVNEYIEEKGLY